MTTTTAAETTEGKGKPIPELPAPVMNTISKDKLKNWRKTHCDANGKKMTQRAAAWIFGVALRTWQHWETGEIEAPMWAARFMVLLDIASMGEQSITLFPEPSDTAISSSKSTVNKAA